MNHSTPSHNGYLEIILGPMFSGKTSKILELYKQCEFSNIPVIVINHISDDRYSDTMLSTHDKQMIPCIKVEKLFDLSLSEELQQKVLEAKVILINEGQFFSDLYEWVSKMVDIWSKEIYVCGLDGDSNREKFGQMLDLIPICDKVNKLKSICSICKNGTRAIFSLRLSNQHQQVLIGSDCYKPVCRNCYIENVNKVAKTNT
jgi:thymidine kinase